VVSLEVLGSNTHGGLMSHAVEPIANHIPRCDRCCLSNQDQKDGLECILGILSAAKNSPTDSENHRPVPTYQRAECVRVATLDEIAKQGTVCSLRTEVRCGSASQASDDSVQSVSSHGLPNLLLTVAL